MAGMLWNGLIARYSGWKMEFFVEIFQEKILHLHVFSRQEVALLELVRHANHLGCHLHNPTKKKHFDCKKALEIDFDLQGAESWSP